MGSIKDRNGMDLTEAEDIKKTWKEYTKAWQPTPLFLPGESYGQRSLAGYSPWSCKELDMTEVT